MFIAAMSNTWLVWAKRQHSNLRQKDHTVTLAALINNLTDKARTKNKSSPSRLALYSQKGQDNKSKGDKGNKGKGKDKAKC